MNAFFKGVASIGEGMVSIGEGMASMCGFGSLADKPEIREILDRTDEEAFAMDAKALEADMEAITSDYKKLFGQR